MKRMTDPLYRKFVEKWDEVTELPQQTVGPLTPIYRKTIPYFKVAPWRVLMPLSFIIIATIALALEITAVGVASFLQRGF